jgi:hypothetical protein
MSYGLLFARISEKARGDQQIFSLLAGKNFIKMKIMNSIKTNC